MCCSCQGCAHVPEKAYLYDTIVQTTNHTATRVQSLTATAEYQVAEPQIQTGDNILSIYILALALCQVVS